MDLDASVLLKKVMEQVLLRCVQAAPATNEGSTADDPVDVLAGRLAGSLMTLLGGGDGGTDGRPGRDELERALGDLAARDQIVASALGACACWGADRECTSCGGRGAPGWRLPKRKAFRALVAPALRRLNRRREPMRAARVGQSVSQ